MEKYSENREIYYHGTRAEKFDVFDLKALGTGEGAHAGNGMYFSKSLKGACNHALLKSRQKGEPKLYVCQIKSSANILTIDNAITNHNEETQRFWASLPVWLSTKIGHKWFQQLSMQPDYSNDRETQILDDEYVCNMLKNNGVDVLRNYESGEFLDSYLFLPSHLVLNTKVIEIIEIIEIIDIKMIESELFGSPRNYYLEEFADYFGNSSVMSRLRVLSK